MARDRPTFLIWQQLGLRRLKATNPLTKRHWIRRRSQALCKLVCQFEQNPAAKEFYEQPHLGEGRMLLQRRNNGMQPARALWAHRSGRYSISST